MVEDIPPPGKGQELPEELDPTEPDMNPQTKGAGDDTTDPTESGEPGSEDSESSPGSDPADGGETSATPSDGGEDPTAVATEAGAGSVNETIVAALHAAIEAQMASAPEEDVRPRKIRFKPTITKEMLERYEKATNDGREAEGLSELIGMAIEEFGQALDGTIIQPMEKVVSEAKRKADNEARVAEWAAKNPKRANDTAMWRKMSEIYNRYATKFGRSRADRITVEQLVAAADAENGLRPSKPDAGGKAPASQKAAALAAAATPKGVGTIRSGKAPKSKPSVGYTGAGYREHLRSMQRDPF